MNQGSQERFGQLRSVAHSLSRDERWRAIVALLDDWPHDELEQLALPYLSDLLRDDDSPRAAPKGWLSLDDDMIKVHPAWRLVRTLHLVEITPAQFIELARSPYLNALTTLDLEVAGIKDEGAVALSQSELGQLRELNLSYNELSDEGVIALTQSHHLKQLTVLDLSDNEISERGAEALARWPALNKLWLLKLSNNQISDRGVGERASAERFGYALLVLQSYQRGGR